MKLKYFRLERRWLKESGIEWAGIYHKDYSPDEYAFELKLISDSHESPFANNYKQKKSSRLEGKFYFTSLFIENTSKEVFMSLFNIICSSEVRVKIVYEESSFLEYEVYWEDNSKFQATIISHLEENYRDNKIFLRNYVNEVTKNKFKDIKPPMAVKK